MQQRNYPLKTMLERAFAAAFLLLLPFSILPGPRVVPPPPPRYVPIQIDAHVIVVRNADEGRGSPSLLARTTAVAGDTSLLSMTASAASVAAGARLHYAVTVTNATTTTQTFRLTDTLPTEVTYVISSSTGGFVYDPASASLTATVPLAAFQGDVIVPSGAPTYTELSGLQFVNNICALFTSVPCDNKDVTLTLPVPFRYLGVDYKSITLNSNGFVAPGSIDTRPGNQNQNLPDPATPNNVIAPFWADLHLKPSSGIDPTGGDWYWDVLQDGAAEYLVVEWHNALNKNVGATSYSFQVWIQLNAEHNTFAYDHLSGDTSSATIGFENSDGTLGKSYLFNGVGAVPPSGTQLQVIGVEGYSTAALGYDVQANNGLRGCSTINNTVNLSGDSVTATVSATATTAIFGPCLYLSIINR